MPRPYIAMDRWKIIIIDKNDIEVQKILDVLVEYQHVHPNAQIEARRRNPVSIRIRIVDLDFKGMSRVDRAPEIWKLLKRLPADVFVNITMLLLLTPKEMGNSLAYLTMR